MLARDPVCVLCRQAPSTIADHIDALDPGNPYGDMSKWRLENGRGLCHPCHNRLHIEEGRVW